MEDVMVTGVEQIDNVTVHFGNGYLFRLRLSVGRWVSVIVHLLNEQDPADVRAAVSGELNKKGIKWDVIQYDNNQCYSKFETADKEV